MDRRHFILSTVAVFTIGAGAALAAAKLPETWDGLVQMKSKRFDAAYIAPGADFRPYNKVMIDPVEIAFHKNYVRDYNRDQRSLDGQIRDRDVQRVVASGSKAATGLFAKAFTAGGYQVVTDAGPDVVRVRSGVVDIHVNAPDLPTAGRRYTASREAGSATLVVEARDSMTGALLGRVLDRRFAGDTFTQVRTSVSNRGDFAYLFNSWAKKAVTGFTDLRAMPSPAAQ